MSEMIHEQNGQIDKLEKDNKSLQHTLFEIQNKYEDIHSALVKQKQHHGHRNKFVQPTHANSDT
jgi:hypothetical protein